MSVPLWLFAVPYMAYLKISGYDLGMKDVIFNLMLLNWFARIPGMTPYWFITAIATFYVAVLLLSHVRKISSRVARVSFVLIVGAIVLQCSLSVTGIRYGYILILITCGLLCFLNAKVFYEKPSSYSCKYGATVLAILLFVGFWIGVVRDAIIVGTPGCYYATIPVALCITAMVFGLPRYVQENAFVCFVSAMSYEVYLVHSAMLLLMKSFSYNSFMYASLFLAGTFLLAIPLHFASSGIFKLMERQI